MIKSRPFMINWGFRINVWTWLGLKKVSMDWNMFFWLIFFWLKHFFFTYLFCFVWICRRFWFRWNQLFGEISNLKITPIRSLIYFFHLSQSLTSDHYSTNHEDESFFTEKSRFSEANQWLCKTNKVSSIRRTKNAETSSELNFEVSRNSVGQKFPWTTIDKSAVLVRLFQFVKTVEKSPAK